MSPSKRFVPMTWYGAGRSGIRNSNFGIMVTTKLTTSLDTSRSCLSLDTHKKGTINMSNLLDI